MAALLIVGGLAPPSVQGQPERIGDQFAQVTVRSAPGTYFDDSGILGTEEICFAGETRYAGDEVFCGRAPLSGDGLTLERVSTGLSDIGLFTSAGVGDDLFFVADGGTDGRELWSYDGSTVRQVADINTGSEGSKPRDLTFYDGDLYFSAEGPSGQRELWRWTESSAERVANLNGSDSGQPAGLVVYDGALHFAGFEPGPNIVLRSYDGSTVRQVADLSDTGPFPSPPDNLTAYDGALYFTQASGDGRELHVYDGSTVIQVDDIYPGTDGIGRPNSADPSGLTVYSGALYFSARDETSNDELWRYDGTGPPTEVAEINSGSEGSSPSNFTVYDGGSGDVLYFSANGGLDGEELWRYDGTSAPSQVADIDPEFGSSPRGLVVASGTLYFSADASSAYSPPQQLWSYDGSTVARTTPSNNPTGGPGEKVVYDGTLYFSATGEDEGNELWQYDGSTITQAADVLTGPTGSFPEDFAVYDGRLYFTVQETGSGSGRDLYFYDGFGTSEVGDFTRVQELTRYAGALYFSARETGSSDREELWRLNGPAPENVADALGSQDGYRPSDLTRYDGALYFVADSESGGGQTLWRYDGTTFERAAFENTQSPKIWGLTVYKGILYFAADGDGDDVRELWGFNGSTTSNVSDVTLSVEGAAPIVYDDGSGAALYFNAASGAGIELHAYDDAAGTTTQVEDINASGDAVPKDFAIYNDRLYFTARDGTSGREPHAYDGTSVTDIDIYPGTPSGGGSAPIVYDDGSGDKLYVSATDGQSGVELYRFGRNTAPLPVELTSVEATRAGESTVELTWQTASEQNNAGFEVQHRRSGEREGRDPWETIDFVASNAEGGTSTEALRYRFVAEDLSVGAHQFRLRQVDLDGTAHLHDPASIELRMQEAVRLGGPAPNPVRGPATVSFAVKEKTETRLTLYNTLGQRVRTVYRGTPAAGEAQTARLDASGLASGVYFLRLTAGGATETTRVTVVR